MPNRKLKNKSPKRTPAHKVNEKNGGKNKGETKKGLSFTPYYTSRNAIETYIKFEKECFENYGCGSHELSDDVEDTFDISFIKTNPPTKRKVTRS